MKRLLQFSLIVLSFALYGIGVNIISGIASPVAAPQLISEPMPPEPPTSVGPETTDPTSTLVELHPTTTKPVIKPKIITVTSIVRQTTTTTTEAPKTPLEIAQSQVGKTGPYAEGGWWCAKFVSYVGEQAKVEGWQSSDSPARLHAIAEDQDRLTDTPLSGYLVFIDLTAKNNANDYISHVGIVESVEGDVIHTMEGNADDSGLVTHQTRYLGDGFVIDFAPFSQGGTYPS
jgi:CHAP domain